MISHLSGHHPDKHGEKSKESESQYKLGAEHILLHHLSLWSIDSSSTIWLVQRGDLPTVQSFKWTVAGEFEQHFTPSCLHTVKNLPVLCAGVDLRHAHLWFLSTKQREIAREQLTGQMESQDRRRQQRERLYSGWWTTRRARAIR